jgi:meiotically up-regulated gene 157 (Mug157) protein
MSDVQTARSYRGSVVDDNMVVSINFKWALQLLALMGTLVYGYYRIESRLATLENELVEADSQIRSLLDKHSVEEGKVSFHFMKKNSTSTHSVGEKRSGNES